MKIRNGFVSNSSSSSFVVFGVEVSCRNLEKYGFVFPELEDENNYDEIGEALYCACEDVDLDSSDMGTEGDEFGIGLSPDEMGEDETLAQFKARAMDKIREVLPKLPEEIKITYIEVAETDY